MFNTLPPITQFEKIRVDTVNQHLKVFTHEGTHYINYDFLTDHGLCSEYLLVNLLTIRSSLRLAYYKRSTITLIKFQDVLEAATEELYEYMFVADIEIDPAILEMKTYLINELARLNCLIAAL